MKQFAPNGFHDYSNDVDPAEDWELMVEACVEQPDWFTPKELGFLESMQQWWGEPTEKQLNWLVALFERVRR
jgi:hypothetical protein